MSFSGALQLTGLDDFLGPGQACIKPMLDSAAASAAGPASNGPASSGSLKPTKDRIEISEDGSAHQVDETGKRQALPKAEITLSDCLACAGCVTSAEAVLVNAQSVTEFRKRTSSAEPLPLVVSVAPQSTAALAARFGCSFSQSFAAVRRLMQQRFGALAVLDTDFGRYFSIRETTQEFVDRKRQASAAVTKPASPAAGAPPARPASAPTLPLLASACPGWICYAEKTHGPLLWGNVAAAKSPQQVLGALVKRATGPAVFHVTVMPCYDKKLEAAREDFVDADNGTTDVDCVLTTSELLQLFEEETQTGLFATAAVRDPPETTDVNGGGGTVVVANGDTNSALARTCRGLEQLFAVHRSPEDSFGSGGYAEQVFRAAAQQLYSISPENISWKQQRNRDFLVAELFQHDSPAAAGAPKPKPLLRFAIMNGFRNIQTLVRRMKTGKLNFDFVEVMACPSGCLNGGGQVKFVDELSDKANAGAGGSETPVSAPAQKKKRDDGALMASIKQKYLQKQQQDPPQQSAATAQDQLIADVYQTLGDDSSHVLRTQYHVRDAPVNPLAIKW